MFYLKYTLNVSSISFSHKLMGTSLFFLHLACIHSLLNHKLVVFFFSILLADFTYWKKLLTPRPPQKKNESTVMGILKLFRSQILKTKAKYF